MSALGDQVRAFVGEARVVAVVGSRELNLAGIVQRVIEALPAGVTVVSGGARGVDTMAEVLARGRGLAVEVFAPAWRTHGRRAGLIRNDAIVARAEVVVAVWDGRSAGTRHTVEQARRAGKPVLVVESAAEGLGR
jgi:predicted Rossmann fold nucleotide-binding protein DprA/Smf involved in DNA uptake